MLILNCCNLFCHSSFICIWGGSFFKNKIKNFVNSLFLNLQKSCEDQQFSHTPRLLARYLHLTLIATVIALPKRFSCCTRLHGCAHVLSSCSEGGSSPAATLGLLTVGASSAAEHSIQGEQAQELWLTGLAAPWHVEPSWTRDRTRVSCAAGQILNHWTTRKSCVFKHSDYANSASHALFVRDCRRYQKRSPTRISVVLSKPKYFFVKVRSCPERGMRSSRPNCGAYHIDQCHQKEHLECCFTEKRRASQRRTERPLTLTVKGKLGRGKVPTDCLLGSQFPRFSINYLTAL